MDQYKNLDLIVIDNEPEVLESQLLIARELGLRAEGFLKGSKAYDALNSLANNELPKGILSDINLGTDDERPFPLEIFYHLAERGVGNKIRYFTGTYSRYDAKLQEKTEREVYLKSKDCREIIEWLVELKKL